ncbi:MAG: hypothetical protein ACQESF_04740 [Nanobdellota archaeon]
MALENKIHNVAGKTLAAGTALYIGICGLPGLAGKEDMQVSQQPPATEQVQQESYLKQAAYELFGEGVAEAADESQSLKEKYPEEPPMKYVEKLDRMCPEYNWVGNYYDMGEPVNNSDYPDGTRWVPWNDPSRDICSNKVSELLQGDRKPPLKYKKLEHFKEDFYPASSEMGQKLREAISQHGVNLEKFENLVNYLGQDKAELGFYRTDREGKNGYIFFNDWHEEKGFILPTTPGIADTIYSVYK